MDVKEEMQALACVESEQHTSRQWQARIWEWERPGDVFAQQYHLRAAWHWGARISAVERLKNNFAQQPADPDVEMFAGSWTPEREREQKNHDRRTTLVQLSWTLASIMYFSLIGADEIKMSAPWRPVIEFLERFDVQTAAVVLYLAVVAYSVTAVQLYRSIATDPRLSALGFVIFTVMVLSCWWDPSLSTDEMVFIMLPFSFNTGMSVAWIVGRMVR